MFTFTLQKTKFLATTFRSVNIKTIMIIDTNLSTKFFAGNYFKGHIHTEVLCTAELLTLDEFNERIRSRQTNCAVCSMII